VDKEPTTRFAVCTPTAPDGTFHAFEYLIEARDEGTTVLRFVHSGFLSDDWGDEYEDMTSAGWNMYLHTLAQYLKYFAGQPVTYLAAEAAPSAAGPGAWELLWKALGLVGPIEQGQRVRLTPAGMPPIVGVADYVAPGEEFLGVRTDDALYRFHGRARLGMPVAVAHHRFGANVDREQEQRVWQSWLHGTLG
jgi:hypothetical protein